MKCVICKLGEIKSGLATVTLNRGDSTVVIKNVSADICENCGEYYLSKSLAERTLQLAESAVQRSAELEVMKFMT